MRKFTDFLNRNGCHARARARVGKEIRLIGADHANGNLCMGCFDFFWMKFVIFVWIYGCYILIEL